jgi:ribosomal protein S18 acetylase RimI-like enzyme
MFLERIQLDDDLLQLYLSIYPEMIKNSLPDYDRIQGIFGDQAQWYGLRHEGLIVAFCTIGMLGDKVFLYNVGVCPVHRRQQFGTHLIRLIINLHQNCDLYLFVKKDNRIAIKLYRKFHFEYSDNEFLPPPGELCFVRKKNSI